MESEEDAIKFAKKMNFVSLKPPGTFLVKNAYTVAIKMSKNG